MNEIGVNAHVVVGNDVPRANRNIVNDVFEDIWIGKDLALDRSGK